MRLRIEMLISGLKFRWKFGRIYKWPLHRRLAWLLLDDGRYISDGRKFVGSPDILR